MPNRAAAPKSVTTRLFADGRLHLPRELLTLEAGSIPLSPGAIALLQAVSVLAGLRVGPSG